MAIIEKKKHTRILVTGDNGFIGKNLCINLRQFFNLSVSSFNRGDDLSKLSKLVFDADFIVHLAGENRPSKTHFFQDVNVDLTKHICDLIVKEKVINGKIIPLIFASSVQVRLKSPYGISKALAEKHLKKIYKENQIPIIIYRLPNVFGKWSKPNYNSVVATFCYNISRGLPIEIHDPEKTLNLVYIDDVILSMIESIFNYPAKGFLVVNVSPVFKVKLGALAQYIRDIEFSRNNLAIPRTGASLIRALYATYISFLPTSKFSYLIPIYRDERGVFVEMLKTLDSGQFSYFSISVGVTRGSHYHHTKIEKFLVLKGKVKMRFRNILNGEEHSVVLSSDDSKVLESIPGWAHDITNVGISEAFVMLWANEIFNRDFPDCIPYDLSKNEE